MSDTDAWGRICTDMKSTIGKEAYQSWISPLALDRIDDGTAHFATPTSFIGRWVDRNYGDRIRSSFAREGYNVTRLNFARRCARAG